MIAALHGGVGLMQIRLLLMASMVLASIGYLAGCSDDESNQGSPPQGSSPPVVQPTSLRLQSISTHLSSPVFMTTPGHDTTHLFVVEQGGRIRIFDVTT